MLIADLPFTSRHLSHFFWLSAVEIDCHKTRAEWLIASICRQRNRTKNPVVFHHGASPDHHHRPNPPIMKSIHGQTRRRKSWGQHKRTHFALPTFVNEPPLAKHVEVSGRMIQRPVPIGGSDVYSVLFAIYFTYRKSIFRMRHIYLFNTSVYASPRRMKCRTPDRTNNEQRTED